MMTEVHAVRPAGFLRDLASVSGRAVRGILREPESFIPGLIIPLFFFVVNVGQLSKVSSQFGTIDYKAFQLPVAIVFAVTGISRASSLVTDIQSGYFDRLLMTPIKRLALLLGLMASDLFFALMLSVPVLLLGVVLGIKFATGVPGMLAFLGFSALWALAFTGFPYAIALKTGSPAAVSSSFILFFPFSFLTTTFLPKEALSGWFGTVASYNPVTYLLQGLRSIIGTGWIWADIWPMLVAIGAVGTVSISLSLLALRGRVRRG